MFEGVFWEQVRSGERQRRQGSKEECSKVSKTIILFETKERNNALPKQELFAGRLGKVKMIQTCEGTSDFKCFKSLLCL